MKTRLKRSCLSRTFLAGNGVLDVFVMSPKSWCVKDVLCVFTLRLVRSWYADRVFVVGGGVVVFCCCCF